jgi:hypothetical protein
MDPIYWESEELALEYFRTWCKVGNNPHGGFQVNKTGGIKPANSLRGRQHKFVCSKHKKPVVTGAGCKDSSQIGTDCKWYIRVEESTEGWCIYNANFVHNHDLSQSLAEANTGGGNCQ